MRFVSFVSSFIDSRSRWALLLVGVGLIYWGYREYRVSSGAASEPRNIELEQLESGGPIDNTYVRVGRHAALFDALVYSTRSTKNDPNPLISYSLYPIVSSAHPDFRFLDAKGRSAADQTVEPPLPLQAPFKVLVKTESYYRLAQVPASSRIEPSLEGLVVNRIDRLHWRAEDLIRKSFPTVNVNDLIILEQDRRPSTPVVSFGLMSGGLLAIVFAGAVAFVARRERAKHGNRSVSVAATTRASVNGEFDSMGIGFRLLLYVMAGATSTIVILAIRHFSWSGLAIAIVAATPFNVPLFLAAFATFRTDSESGAHGLPRPVWRTLLAGAYLAGIGGLIWMAYF